MTESVRSLQLKCKAKVRSLELPVSMRSKPWVFFPPLFYRKGKSIFESSRIHLLSCRKAEKERVKVRQTQKHSKREWQRNLRGH